MGIKLNLKRVRIGWVNVFEKAQDTTAPDGKPIKGKFQLTAYLDKDDPQINQLDATVLEVLTEGMKSAKAAEKWMDRNYGFGNHADKCAVRDLAEHLKRFWEPRMRGALLTLADTPDGAARLSPLVCRAVAVLRPPP